MEAKYEIILDYKIYSQLSFGRQTNLPPASFWQCTDGLPYICLVKKEIYHHRQPPVVFGVQKGTK